MNTFFTGRDGQPVFVTGLQAHNSSTGTPLLQTAMDAIRLYGGNTLEAPVYWYAIEPEEDVYDLTQVRELIKAARERGLYLIILWFGANKNGHPNYAPEYIKLQPEVYRIAEGPDHAPVPSVSVHCEATVKRDCKAFVKLMECIRDDDPEADTVLAVQIENEFGYCATDRDYSELGDRDFAKAVPEELLGIVLPEAGEFGTEEELLQRGLQPDGLSHDGSWTGEFGRHACEAFSAYYHARYVEELAAAGKEVLDIPFLANIFIGEVGIEYPGFSYNGGGGVGRMIDIWKAGAPHLDLLCPDIYPGGKRVYERVCGRYAREDNALFIPESSISGDANAMNLILAVGKYDAIGVCAFGAESALDLAGELLPSARKVADSMKAVAGLAPLLIKYRGSGRVHAFVQDEFTTEEYLSLPKYHVTAQFIKGNPEFRGHSSTVNLHAPENAWLLEERGRGILIQTGEDEFYLAGCGIGFDFRRRPAIGDPKAYVHLSSRQATQLNFLSVEEGHFEGDTFVTDFIRNGDESNFLVYSHRGQVVRVRLNPNTGC